MRHQALSIAAVACLAMTACSPANPMDTPSPTDVLTSAVQPAETESSAAPTATPEVESTESAMTAPPTGDTQTPKAPGTTSSPSGGGGTDRDVDLADQAFAVTAQQAVDKGMGETGDGIVHSIELDWSQRQNAWVYELDILVGNVDHDVDVHADTSEILEHERDTTDDKEQAINLNSPMTWETARDKALDTVQGRITSWKLEWDDNRTSYEFDIEDSAGDQTEVTVDVQTGDVRMDD